MSTSMKKKKPAIFIASQETTVIFMIRFIAVYSEKKNISPETSHEMMRKNIFYTLIQQK